MIAITGGGANTLKPHSMPNATHDARATWQPRTIIRQGSNYKLSTVLLMLSRYRRLDCELRCVRVCCELRPCRMFTHRITARVPVTSPVSREACRVVERGVGQV